MPFDLKEQEVMESLTRQQTKFVFLFVGGHPLVEAGYLAGYNGNQVYQVIKSKSVVRVIAILEKLHQLENGEAMAKKREMLLGIARNAARLGQ